MNSIRAPSGILGEKMPLKMTRPKLLAGLLATCFIWPAWSWGLGLGDIRLHSALNEPLNAEIELLAAAPDELSGLRATLAPREAFTRYGLDKPPFLSTLSFTVGKGKDGQDALLVRSSDSISEPFVTFLVEVNWSRGRLLREYTVLLDPPIYSPGASPGSAAPATVPAALPAVAAAPTLRRAAAPMPPPVDQAAPAKSSAPPQPRKLADLNAIPVNKGDTLTKIARGLQGGAATPVEVDKTMIALFRANRAAFGGNINVLREGAVLRVPDAGEIAALNQEDAIGEVQRQMAAWKAGESAAGGAGGHLRLVAPGAGDSASGSGNSNAANSTAAGPDTAALKDRVKDLEAQLAETKRLIEIRNNELSALQRKLGAAAAAAAATEPVAPPPPLATTAPKRPAAIAPPAAALETPASAVQPPTAPPAAAPAVTKPPVVAPPESGSWIDWVAENWWVPVALLVVVLGALGWVAMRRRRNDETAGLDQFLDHPELAAPPVPSVRPPAARAGGESFVVEESGEHAEPAPAVEPPRFGDPGPGKLADEALASETAVNLEQGDPLAEADFHMAYGLYDQAADLVRSALEHEPERRDLRLKLLEIYFVWGNKDAFLQTAKSLESTRDRVPAGEWDKIVIMGRQICPDEPMFAASAGGGHGAGAPVDLNLEGGENRVDIDLYGDPAGETSTLDHQFAKVVDETAATGHVPGLPVGSDHLDFTLDAPERGADESSSRVMPARDEPTVESELMNFGEANFLDPTAHDAAGADTPQEAAPTMELPAAHNAAVGDLLAAKLPSKADQTAEVSIDDLGLDVEHRDESGTPSSGPAHPHDHPADAPTFAAGLDWHSRQLLAETDRKARDRSLSDLERELEASFVAELSDKDEMKTAWPGAETMPAPLPKEDPSPTVLTKSSDLIGLHDRHDTDSTSKLRALNADSIDLDLDHLAAALGSGDTVKQPRTAEDAFSNEVFETGKGPKHVDLDVGEALDVVDAPTTRLTEQASGLTAETSRLKPLDLAMPELEPVTMSEVGTKLDLARAYMDMGDPEGARSILEEVVLEGSASQKQEASRLIESLPG
jgi:pilus assembly protein FimV